VYWPRVNLDEEEQRGSEEEGTKRDEGGERESISRLRSPARLAHSPPAMFSLLLPFLPRPPMILSTTASPPSRFETRPRRLPSPPPPPSRPTNVTGARLCVALDEAQREEIGFRSARRRTSFADFCQLRVPLPQSPANMSGSGKKSSTCAAFLSTASFREINL